MYILLAASLGLSARPIFIQNCLPWVSLSTLSLLFVFGFSSYVSGRLLCSHLVNITFAHIYSFEIVSVWKSRFFSAGALTWSHHGPCVQ